MLPAWGCGGELCDDPLPSQHLDDEGHHRESAGESGVTGAGVQTRHARHNLGGRGGPPCVPGGRWVGCQGRPRVENDVILDPAG